MKLRVGGFQTKTFSCKDSLPCGIWCCSLSDWIKERLASISLSSCSFHSNWEVNTRNIRTNKSTHDLVIFLQINNGPSFVWSLISTILALACYINKDLNFRKIQTLGAIKSKQTQQSQNRTVDSIESEKTRLQLMLKTELKLIKLTSQTPKAWIYLPSSSSSFVFFSEFFNEYIWQVTKVKTLIL